MRDFIDFVKDIVTILVGGVIENRAEIKVSEKRREFFKHKGNKISAFFFYGSVIAAVVLAIFGLIELVKEKVLGAIFLVGGIILGLFLIVEWGAAE